MEIWIHFCCFVALAYLTGSNKKMWMLSATLDHSHVVEWLSDDTFISNSVIKRVWPASQRDACFWSHLRHMSKSNDEGPDSWIVVNYSCEHPECPVIFIRFWHFFVKQFSTGLFACMKPTFIWVYVHFSKWSLLLFLHYPKRTGLLIARDLHFCHNGAIFFALVIEKWCETLE